MSEIFNWFKRTQGERLHVVSEVAFPPDQIPLGEEDKRSVELAPELVTPPWGAPVTIKRDDQPKFDLDLADWRMKTVLDPASLPGEQYRFLRTKLSLMQKQRKLKLLLVTSALPGEGKTFTACCLAGILAHEPGKRVLLVDADLRKPATGNNLGMLGSSMPAGLSNLLTGETDLQSALLSSSKLDFFYLPAGPTHNDSSDLLSSANLELTFGRMAPLFDWIIVDSPPILTLADAARLAPLCDGVLLIVQADRTPADLIKKAIQVVGRDSICGIVMNRVKHLKSSRYYHRHYGAIGKPK